MAVAEQPAVFDLYNEDVDDDLPLWAYGVPKEWVAPDGAEPLPEHVYGEADHRQVRAMLVRLRQHEAEAKQIAEAGKAVVGKYVQAAADHQAKAEALRASLLNLLQHGGLGSKLTYPDVATIHLSTAGGNLTLDNQEEAVSTYGFRFEKPVTDITAMNAWARDHHKQQGEVPKGYAVVPQRKTLVVKGA